jgi:serine/threonine protein kinase
MRPRPTCAATAAGIVHRDIKPENFLYLEPTKEATMVLTDFNTGTFLSPGQEPLQEIVGSPYYLAPEVLRRSYGPPVSAWPAGLGHSHAYEPQAHMALGRHNAAVMKGCCPGCMDLHASAALWGHASRRVE